MWGCLECLIVNLPLAVVEFGRVVVVDDGCLVTRLVDILDRCALLVGVSGAGGGL